MGQLLILALVFFVISTVFSMLGLGGGILYVPILLFAGFTIKQAPAISLILIVATSAAALSTYWRNQKVDWKLALVIDPPTDVMAFVGGYFSAWVPERLLQALLAGVLTVAGILMLTQRLDLAGRVAAIRTRLRWHRQFRDVQYTVHLPLVLTATALIGLLSGMIGITGGIIKLPIMVLLCGVPMDIAVATSTVMVAVTAGSGLIGHALHGAVQWRTGLTLALAALAGGLLGSHISISTDKRRLKRGFGVVVLLVAVRLLLQLRS
ncbi:MAG: sulfite exporter TauE/SafE family protein [Planctomycetes bacterium]|nr:sulfite exporter TauE/SafE family protein [Planctomycetota bacterium]